MPFGIENLTKILRHNFKIYIDKLNIWFERKTLKNMKRLGRKKRQLDKMKKTKEIIFC